MKHTQGNWIATKKEFNYIIHSNQSNNGSLAIVGTGLYNSNPLLHNEAEANARLMAAAPELLEALKNLLGIVRTLEMDSLIKTLPNEYRNLLSAYKLDANKAINKAFQS